ncbi:MAG: Jag N-terminal domain-containing protein, partial [Aristaeellaceae bacterium]
MKTYEASAKTKEEAIDAGLEALGVSISDVTVEVIDEGSKGLFGLFGSRLAKVRLTVKETEDDPLADLLNDKPAPKPERKPAPAREERQPCPERKPDAPK